MNPRQRRGAALLVVSLVGAGGVFGAVSSYTASVARQLGPTRPVLTLRQDVSAYEALRYEDVRIEQVPEMYAPQEQMGNFGDIAGRVPAVPLSKGSRLSSDTLVAPPAAKDGERELTVQVGVEAGVAAALEPNDLVDVVAAYRATNGLKAYARTVIAGARVLRVNRLAQNSLTGREDQNQTSVLRGDTELAVTFAVKPRAVNAIVLAQTTAGTLRLALQPRGTLATAVDPVTKPAP